MPIDAFGRMLLDHWDGSVGEDHWDGFVGEAVHVHDDGRRNDAHPAPPTNRRTWRIGNAGIPGGTTVAGVVFVWRTRGWRGRG